MSETYLSTFADDAEFMPLVREYVSGLSAKLEALRGALAENDEHTLHTLAHQLKGSAGMYGYPILMAAAVQLEQDVKRLVDDAKIAERLAKLEAIVRRMEGGLIASRSC